MSYEKLNWQDRLDTGNKYNITDNPDGTKKIEYAGTVNREGTPMSAANFNHMEQGIFDAHRAAAENLQAAKNYTDQKISELPEGKTYSFSEGSQNGTIGVTPSDGTQQDVAVKGLGSAAYTDSSDYATAEQGTKADNAVNAINGSNSAAYVGKFKRQDGTVETVNFLNYAEIKTYATNNFKSTSTNPVKNADIEGFGITDTSIANMKEMFYNCSSLTSLDLSNWNTSDVTSMFFMFDGCSSLKSLNLSDWDTTNVTMMSYMFSGCSSLKSLNLSGWDTSHVEHMYSMFHRCYSLEYLDLSGWNTSSVTDMSSMFSNCTSLQTVYVSTPEAKTFIDARLQDAGLSVRATLKYDNAALTQLIGDTNTVLASLVEVN